MSSATTTNADHNDDSLVVETLPPVSPPDAEAPPSIKLNDEETVGELAIQTLDTTTNANHSNGMSNEKGHGHEPHSSEQLHTPTESSQIPLPTPPTPPAKSVDDSTDGKISPVSFQEVILDAPPPPIEKSPTSVPPHVNGHGSARPASPFTPPASWFSRPRTSESLPSPGLAPGHQRNLTMSRGNTVSVVLISSALETIASSREAKKSAQLKESVDSALGMVRSGQGGDRPREIFEPLRLACETRNEKLMIASLDCISKLISHSFFIDSERPLQGMASPPASPGVNAPRTSSSSQRPAPSLVDLVTSTITACHTETTPDTVSLQIVKALLSLVLSSTLLVHQSSLLKAVRTVYNIFIMSHDPVNQTVAQGGLTQMVNHVFSRCQRDGSRHESVDHHSGSIRSRASSKRPSLASSTPEISPPNGKAILNTRGHSTPSSDTIVEPSEETNGQKTSPELPENTPSSPQAEGLVPAEGSTELRSPQPRRANLQTFEIHNPNDDLVEEHGVASHAITTEDMFIKDAFLVFRALCKLTMKPLNTESERDFTSEGMRSKLLTLHLVLTVLNAHMAVFAEPWSIIYSTSSNETTTFINATKQYLCLSLSRNALSPVPQVFEISVELFWRVLSGLRTKLKKEIEVFFHEIFVPILEMKTSTLKQKGVILGMLLRLCQEPQALVEIYLNYDCDREAADNIYEHLMNTISKIATTHSTIPQKGHAHDPLSPSLKPSTKDQAVTVPPSLSTAALAVPGNADNAGLGFSESQLKRQGLECLVAVLRSLVAWGTAARKTTAETAAETTSQSTPNNEQVDGMASDASLDKLSVVNSGNELSREPTPDLNDDPGKFVSAKQRKTTLLEGIKKFNFKPKKGIEFLVDSGFIPTRSPYEIAKFLLQTDGMNKTMIGEYLGEGDDENIAIMHAFVDQLDFTNLPFVDALRVFLQSFRLPGEAQKIDRFMLKFAERYIAGNAQTPFANADCAYVLSYSTIMLNTDAHNPQVKNRMTKLDFIRNNRGINDDADLPEDFLSAIFDDILSNEIRMKDEVEASLVLPNQGPGIANALANVGRDLQKEAYVMQSHGMANKTEALFKTLMRTQRKGSKGSDQFFSASHFIHVRPMFEVAWIPFLAGISGPLQDTDDMEVVELCLDGFKNAIRIVCFFDMELERNAFVTTLAKFTFLNNLGEMKTKNMEAIKALLDIAVTEGNYLKGSWHEVLTCVSQLERMQLISSGIDVPDGKKGRSRKLPAEELANESRSTHITVAADMVFSLSHYLSGDAIVDFVKALSSVSWEEIQSSVASEHPRLFSLQKLVEISYYNMNRIRLEWSHLWDILGEHFNQVCCHHNPHVGFFALDALRQLAMRFLEKEELPHFKFQKDFLKPFEYTMTHNANPDIRDMVLQCIQQMIQARVQNMRSGWRTMFGVFSAASKVLTERVVNSAFEIVSRLNEDHFSAVVRYGAFADLTVCITDFCKVSKFQKISLLAIAMLRGVIPSMLECPECPLSTSHALDDAHHLSSDDPMIKFWFPVLFSFYDIIMNGEDLEVRRLALDSLFSTLKTYGSSFPVEFWDTVCQELLFPIFAVLKSTSDLTRWTTQEDMSVWLSTTLIQALRDLIDLYTYFFDTLERFLDGLLELLCVCICQENDTLARIGTSCLQQLLESNVKKLSPTRWERVTTTFVKLFKTTTPHQLFDDSLRAEIDGSSPDISDTSDASGLAIIPAPLSPHNSPSKSDVKVTAGERRRIFKQIIVKCVLQLLLIETTNELLQNDEVYNTIPPEHLLRLMGVLDHSYQFARVFNEDKDLRTALWKVGFMKHLPNLLKQETSSAATLVNILARMYYDTRPEYQALRPQIVDKLLPLGLGVMQDFNKLRPETHAKNIASWTPVIAEILNGFCRFDDKAFSRYMPVIYPPAAELLTKDLAVEVRLGLRDFFTRVGRAQGITEDNS
ncbi:Sec7-domain-containing protein [Rickenella mellea]|uniref:Sec7-domain-containing protein n=1 Tax=Rickenella mellea TaxID=50990 RepID=A0A4R5XF54_9AGAM|nr:Sec7-domain-containing protein [Rickenella mellea]